MAEAVSGESSAVDIDRPSSAELRSRAPAYFEHGRCTHCSHSAGRHFAEPILESEPEWKLVCWGPGGGSQCRCRIRWAADGDAYIDPTIN